MHEARVFEAIAAASAGDHFGLQRFGVEADGTAEEDVEAFEGNAGNVGAESIGEGVVGRCAGPGVVDACEIGVDVEGLRHYNMAPAWMELSDDSIAGAAGNAPAEDFF